MPDVQIPTRPPRDRAPAGPDPDRVRFTPPRVGLGGRVVDRFHDWRTDSRAGIVVLVVVAVVAGVVWYQLGAGGGGGASTRARSGPAATAPPGSPGPELTTDLTTDPAARARDAEPTAARAAARSDAPTRLVVHVAGAVTRPGVVELAAGARVIDALEAVGGAVAEADLDRLNLAATLVDGQRVFVPRTGEADPGVVDGSSGGATGTGGPGADVPALGARLNLNTATQAQLEALPGIGPAYAQAILAERQRRGRFTSVNELRSVRGIGEKRFAQLAPLVTV